MFKSSTTRSALFAAVLSMGLGMAPAMAQPGVQTGAKSSQVTSKVSPRANQRRTFMSDPSNQTYKKRGPGWSTAHVQRMATKSRNKARNRKAHR